MTSIRHHTALIIAVTAVMLSASLFLSPQAQAAVGDGASSNIQLLDTNANGEIDRITFNVANPNLESWVLGGVFPHGVSVLDGGSGNAITVSAIAFTTAINVNPVGVQIDLNEADADLEVDTSVSAVELVYTAGPADNIADGVDEQVNAISAVDTNATDTEADAAAPQVDRLTYGDADADGKIDLLTLVFSEEISATSELSAADITPTVGDFTGLALGSGTGDLITEVEIGVDTTLAIDLTNATLVAGGASEATAVDTADNSGNFTLTFANFTFTDGTTAYTTGHSVASTDIVDGAAPVPVAGSGTVYMDLTGGDAVIDRILINYSESVTSTGVVPVSRFTLTSVTGANGFGGSLFGNALDTGGDISVSMTGAESNETSHVTAPTIAYNDNSDDATNYLADAAGLIVQTHGAIALYDLAGPIVLSVSPSNGGTLIPATIDFTITFSEDLADGSVTTSNITGSATSGPATVDVSEVSGVVTVSPTGASFSSGATVTITLNGDTGGLSDANNNVLRNTGTVVALTDSGNDELYTFLALNPSSSGGGGGGSPSSVTVTPDAVTLTSPNGGGMLSGGSTVNVVWTSAGNINNVNLSYSLDGGVAFVSIVSGTDNDGSYAWSVPNINAPSVRLRVVGRDAGGATLATDLSDTAFAIELNASMPAVNPAASSAPVSMRTSSGSLVEMVPGVLFRGVTLPDVYRVDEDGTRHVFPNETTFFSWGYSFNNVVVVNDDQLRLLTLGARVTIKPGSHLVKIQSDPKVYEVGEGATLTHVPDEATAVARFGPNWAALVRDIPSVFFSDYTIL
ncbi:TPA: hypothetical protein DDZ10_04980 [Candidatus Uhrbacteria bacterium]|nr:MAG: Immunoglobulin I-set domain protein [Parcubacteria group bacterium GW2011_GWA2_53_21]HBL39987.1 hypothetical protein [Candidatus Uhrbacteria bacterium]